MGGRWLLGKSGISAQASHTEPFTNIVACGSHVSMVQALGTHELTWIHYPMCIYIILNKYIIYSYLPDFHTNYSTVVESACIEECTRYSVHEYVYRNTVLVCIWP